MPGHESDCLIGLSVVKTTLFSSLESKIGCTSNLRMPKYSCQFRPAGSERLRWVEFWRTGNGQVTDWTVRMSALFAVTTTGDSWRLDIYIIHLFLPLLILLTPASFNTIHDLSTSSNLLTFEFIAKAPENRNGPPDFLRRCPPHCLHYLHFCNPETLL